MEKLVQMKLTKLTVILKEDTFSPKVMYSNFKKKEEKREKSGSFYLFIASYQLREDKQPKQQHIPIVKWKSSII
ncbi:DUF5117 domain-containing protein [Sesbania bispinosa]|nr:DUF5117 domain-containing protein [Sesbania bispinosa]